MYFSVPAGMLLDSVVLSLSPCVSLSLSLCIWIASSWGKPQGKAFRDGFLHEALDEMSTPATKKSDTMQSSGKWGGKVQACAHIWRVNYPPSGTKSTIFLLTPLWHLPRHNPEMVHNNFALLWLKNPLIFKFTKPIGSLVLLVWLAKLFSGFPV